MFHLISAVVSQSAMRAVSIFSLSNGNVLFSLRANDIAFNEGEVIINVFKMISVVTLVFNSLGLFGGFMPNM